MDETRTTTLRLRTITITCEHRKGRSLHEAHDAALEITRAHGWPSAALLTHGPGGGFTLYRSVRELQEDAGAAGMTISRAARSASDPAPGRALMH